MIRYLSPEWFAAIQDAAEAARPADPPGDDALLVLRQVVTGGPDGEVTYRVAVQGGTVTVSPGDGAADVTLAQDYGTAIALQQGRLSVQAAFMTGRIRVGGDVGALLAHHERLRRVDATFESVRARTDYGEPAGSA